MTSYLAPMRDMKFVIKELAGLSEISALPRNKCVKKAEVSGATHMPMTRLVSVSAMSSPSSAAMAGADMMLGALS